MAQIQRDELHSYLNDFLAVDGFRDYCPNGLQVEGAAVIDRMVTGVTASQALLDAAIAQGAQAVLVHHGYFWKGEEPRVIGVRKRRLATLLRHELSLFAYHLPLDAHPGLGNNAEFARLFGLQSEARCGEQDMVWTGRLEREESLGALAGRATELLQRAPLVIGDSARLIRRLAWCSGGAQSYFETAIAAGVDLFVSGEISEQTVHLARESGVAYMAAGHHATERLGIRALGQHVAEHFGIDVVFVDIENPV